ncbi:MAG: FadR/GntR family transcriptional regulator [Geminicoccaceae bacterium]
MAHGTGILTRPETSNLTDRVTAMLCEQITGGGFSPGDVLPAENLIAQRLGVSRTVLREAISRLKVNGLVASKQGRGLVVLDNRRPSVLRLHSASDQVQPQPARIAIAFGQDRARWAGAEGA